MSNSQLIIPARECIAMSSLDDVVIIDCRNYLDDPLLGRKEFLQAHVKGAHYIDLKEDLSGPVIPGKTGRHPLPDPEVFTYKLRSLGINNNSTILAYDQATGAYASRLWWLLRWLGHDNCKIVDGGYKALLEADVELNNQWLLPAEGNFKANTHNELILERNFILSHAGTVVDSREYKRYSGEHEPIDPVAGHIEGAVCYPFGENLNPDQTWKSPDELAARFEEINGQPVFYCGSGVTACHNILAYKIATGKDALLYPGSWSEWLLYL